MGEEFAIINERKEIRERRERGKEASYARLNDALMDGACQKPGPPADETGSYTLSALLSLCTECYSVSNSYSI